MFTGLAEELGALVERVDTGLGSAQVVVRGPLTTSDARLGDSIAVSGVCLTVTDLDGDCFRADVMPETLSRTTLGRLAPGTPVNLERAMRADTRFGGHIVTGHIDGVGVVTARDSQPRWEVVRVTLPDARMARQIAVKGSIAVDGVSLTVTAVGEEPGDDLRHWFEVSLIPATLDGTTLGASDSGTEVNIETDVLAKYVDRLLEDRET